jgi:hypothetical protein
MKKIATTYVIQGVGACDGCHMDGVRNHTINDPFNTTLRQTKNGINFCPQTTDLSLQRLILQVTIWKHHDSLLIVWLVGTPKQQQNKREKKEREGKATSLSLSLSLSLLVPSFWCPTFGALHIQETNSTSFFLCRVRFKNGAILVMQANMRQDPNFQNCPHYIHV